jgi:hypothetical protein
MPDSLKGMLRANAKQRARRAAQAAQAGAQPAPTTAPAIVPTPTTAPVPAAPPPAYGTAQAVNHRTHGFYSGQFTTEEMALISSFLLDPTLEDEIWMQRVVNRRLLAYLNGDALQDEPPEVAVRSMVRVAEALALGTGRVARLLRDRQALTGDTAKILLDAITTALTELADELGREL